MSVDFEQNGPFPWHGRTDIEDGESGMRWHQHICNHNAEKADAVLHGFSCDLGVENNKGRIGAKDGPNAIRKALCNLAWHSDMVLADTGNTVAEDNLLRAQTHYANAVATYIKSDKFVIGLGGGHEIAWASYQGIEQATSGTIGIINFDAHFDMREPSPDASSGTPFYQIAKHCEQANQAFHYTCIGIAKTANTQALFERAAQTNTRYVLDTDCEFENITATLSPMLDRVDTVYLTLCLDVFAAHAAPGVSAPSALGIEAALVLKVIDWLGKQTRSRSINWPLVDVAEMNPAYDVDQRTAKLAARLIFECIQAKSKV